MVVRLKMGFSVWVATKEMVRMEMAAKQRKVGMNMQSKWGLRYSQGLKR